MGMSPITSMPRAWAASFTAAHCVKKRYCANWRARIASAFSFRQRWTARGRRERMSDSQSVQATLSCASLIAM